MEAFRLLLKLLEAALRIGEDGIVGVLSNVELGLELLRRLCEEMTWLASEI